ncbi:MAG: hypothetical protein IPG69_19425 [Flavobacteriales bacterium]|nr:hypothetical protein [Flavobacteriales bacterium]
MSPLRALRSSLVLCAALCVIAAVAQSEKATVMSKYRRSSLHMVLVEAGDFPNKDVVIKAYHDQPFPDKYNDHKVAANTLDASRYPITETDRILAGYKSEGESSKETQNALASATGGLTAGMMDSTAKDTRLRIDRFIKDTKLANQLVAKWFNRKEDGTMDGDLVVERGAYGATQLEYMVAQGAANKQAFKDAVGDEMIPNTFVVFSKLNFVENEPVARAILDGTRSSLTDTTEFLGKLALASAQAVYNSTKDGYSVWTTSWLYQLVWNDSIQYRFWKELWIDDRNVDSLKKAAFDTTDLFQLSYVGSEKSRSLVAANLEQGGVAEEGDPQSHRAQLGRHHRQIAEEVRCVQAARACAHHGAHHRLHRHEGRIGRRGEVRCAGTHRGPQDRSAQVQERGHGHRGEGKSVGQPLCAR